MGAPLGCWRCASCVAKAATQLARACVHGVPTSVACDARITRGADAYDWIFGWNDIGTAGTVYLFYYDRQSYYHEAATCSIPAYSWGHCSWGGSFTGYYAGLRNSNYYSNLGVTVHSAFAVVR